MSDFLIQLRGLFSGWAEFAVSGEATGKQVAHRSGLDLLVFVYESFGSFDGLVNYI